MSHKLHAQSQLQCTMWHDEDITTQVELADPTNVMDPSTTYLRIPIASPRLLYICYNVCASVYSGRGAQVKLGYTGNV